MLVSSSVSVSKSLSFLLAPPLIERAGDLSGMVVDVVELGGDALPVKVGVAVCARDGGGRMVGGRALLFLGARVGLIEAAIVILTCSTAREQSNAVRWYGQSIMSHC